MDIPYNNPFMAMDDPFFAIDDTAIDGPAIIGSIERIENTHIYGWAINKEKSPLTLSLSIDDKTFHISPSWSMRFDIAQTYGDDFYQSGFAIEIPPKLAKTFLQARQHGKPVNIIANGITLSNPAKASVPAPYTASTQRPPLIGAHIKGYIEGIDGLHVYGWAINQKQEDMPLKLSLLVEGKPYPVIHEGVERQDIAGKFGADFLQSGFNILIPDNLIDTFFQMCEQGETIGVMANDVILHNIADPIKFDPNLLGTELASTPNRYQLISEINAEAGIPEVGAEAINQLLAGQINVPLRVSRIDGVNARYYLELAKQKFGHHNTRTLLKISLFFERQPEALELLGNTYFDQQDYDTAISYYEAAAKQGGTSKWLVSNLLHGKSRIGHPKDAVRIMLDAIGRSPESNTYREQFDALVNEYWLKQQGALETYATTGDRTGLVGHTCDAAQFIYQAYLHFYGADGNPCWVGSCDLERVLIVGDFHIPQCIRYRIDQKIEQLEAAGKIVTAVSWTDLANQQNALAFHDIVIFYRVPAEPPVLKAMAQVNATGRLSIYEIDDLLFDTAYPPAIETYGGYVDIGTYTQILKGMGSFNAAARCCRFGLASTQDLADKLQTLVFGGKSFLHRNGIDSQNLFKQKSYDPTQKTLDIFYGSGTMAHNSDFSDLALPAICRLLDEYPQLSLTIAGYLKLPAAFLAGYADRIRQMPPVKSIKAYWSLLERTDISLAVLHDDVINGCKSELKWFEAACLGIPSVVSTTANYRTVIKNGEDGFIATTAEDWYLHLKALIDDPNLRQTMAQKAQARVRAEYSIEALAENIRRILGEALAAAQQPVRTPRKKIALVNVFFPPQSIGGGTRVVSDNFDQLQRDDHQGDFEFSVFTSDADFKPPYQMTLYNHKGVRVYRSTILWRENMDWHPCDEQMATLFSEYLKIEQPDLVHFHCVQRLTASVIEATIKAQIPYIVTAHDAWWISDYQFLVDNKRHIAYPEGHPEPYQPHPTPDNISLSDSFERTLYLKGLLHDAKAVLTVSNRFADIYRKNGVQQIRVNKNGISESLEWQSKDTRHTGKVVCGHVGGMAEHKGYFLLKSAIETLQPTHLEMLIVDHSQEEGYRMQTHWGDVPVTFVGRFGQSRVVNLYRQIDVLFAPSTWPESYGLVTREAAACGCWVVASAMGGIGEDVIDGKSGFVIEPTQEALIRCIKMIERKPSKFKGKPPTAPVRLVSEQVKELTGIYKEFTEGESAS